MKRILLVLVCLASLSFSSLIWEAATDGEITTEPVYFQNNVVLGSLDGYVYALNPDTGARAWRFNLGKTIVDFTVYDGDLIAANTGGKIARIKRDGTAQWEIDLHALFNVSYLYKIDSNSNYLYAATSGGIYRITKGGDASSIYDTENEPTALTVGSNYLFVGDGNRLVRLDGSGKVQWERELESENFWKSDPAISEAGSSVYIGALDNKLHSYHLTGGYEKWDIVTGGWVLTTPLVADNTVFFGSTDGYIYAANADNGNLKWKRQLPLAVVSEPKKGMMGGVEVIFVGGTDGGVYALDAGSGNVVWKGSGGGRVGSPLFYQGKVIFGSSDGHVYAYSTERACSIDSPTDGEFVGRKEVVVGGQSVSEAGLQTVNVNINNMGWEAANTSANGEWFVILNPAERLIEGLNTISCRVVDATGEETGTSFTTVSIIRDSSLPLDNLITTTSTDYIVEGQEFTIYVNSKSDGSAVERFSLEIDGESYTGSKNLTLAVDEPGTYTVTVNKIGFNEGVTTINVSYSGIDPLYIGIAAVLLLIVAWVIYSRFIRKRPAE